jgi:hypothetical protein
MNSIYSFNLPTEENVIARNRTITTYYAQLYKSEPALYKWAGMAAFASFHIGEKLKMWNWKKSGIKTISQTCRKKNRTLEDDFQVIRILNNKIFSEVGAAHLAFSQLDYELFHSQLIQTDKHPIIINAFEKLHHARLDIANGHLSEAIQDLIWEANTEILWHEQSQVVQPLFDKLSDLFSGAMTFVASFDYSINHRKTSWRLPSRFILFMMSGGFKLLRENHFVPSVTRLEHRWYWISKDLLKKWRKIERKAATIDAEIDFLSKLEQRNLRISKR